MLFYLIYYLRLFVQGLNEINPKAAELEESNALALAIVPPGRLRGFLYLSEHMSPWQGVMTVP